ncbi:unknown [Alistipes sp. CAG:435]|nr:unknown [Alistipes sp. CAG:435]
MVILNLNIGRYIAISTKQTATRMTPCGSSHQKPS